MNSRKIIAYQIVALSILGSTTSIAQAAPVASATFDFYIDNLYIERHPTTGITGTVFEDFFNDGNAPPSSPANSNGNVNGYSTFGTFAAGSETTGSSALGQGKLNLSSTGVAASTDAFGNPNFVVRARYNSNTDSGLTGGFKANHKFETSAVFDLSPSMALGTAYGLRLRDTANGGNDNDSAELRIFRSGDGFVHLAWRDVSRLDGTVVVLNDIIVDFNGHDQIALQLEKLDPASKTITASFGYFSGGAFLEPTFHTFSGTQDIFHGENFTQVEFFANVTATNIAAVPEPSTWATLLAGLGLLCFMVRRKSNA